MKIDTKHLFSLREYIDQKHYKHKQAAAYKNHRKNNIGQICFYLGGMRMIYDKEKININNK